MLDEVSAEDTGVIDTEGLISEPIFEGADEELLNDELFVEGDGVDVGRFMGLAFKALISTSLLYLFLVVAAELT